MSTYSHDHHDQGDRGGRPIQEMNGVYGNILPYEDPAIVNPGELATFPKAQMTDHNHHYHHHEHESHLVNRKVPVREGKNMTRTDNHPDRNGYM